MNTKNTLISVGVLVLIIAALVLVMALTNSPTKANAAIDAFAKCLASKDVVVYGAYWCPHCQNQKKLFGSAYQYVPYVECTQETAKCTAKGIDGYPTWIFQDGSRIAGEMSFQELSDKTVCPLPQN
ncbi:MAG: thioredoxin domain-containing protein [Patescibacteria group bacterium]